jgi:hypothetical protein
VTSAQHSQRCLLLPHLLRPPAHSPAPDRQRRVAAAQAAFHANTAVLSSPVFVHSFGVSASRKWLQWSTHHGNGCSEGIQLGNRGMSPMKRSRQLLQRGHGPPLRVPDMQSASVNCCSEDIACLAAAIAAARHRYACRTCKAHLSQIDDILRQGTRAVSGCQMAEASGHDASRTLKRRRRVP